ncbi:transcriptional regulator GutM [Anaerosinus massiliensis]|uniref:transcriptional regulator GutM n=1 Tax=Massilibacillus massiliensis TaxID=1806837 RepID=UPI000DA61EF6|nr:transcriptional regulator GutM [Massilibacillus massiliensis]
MLWLIMIAASMWILQCILGLWQFNKFNRRFKELRTEGRVAIGRAKGRFVAGAVVLLCIDKECNIIKGEKMQGTTIFAGIKPFHTLDRMNLLTINEACCQSLDKQTAKAVLNAVQNYKEFVEKEQMAQINTERIVDH